MFNTTNLIKLGASVAGALLILLFVNWGASALYRVVEESHGDEEQHATQGYVIAPDGAGEDEPAEEEVEVAFADVFAAADPAAGEKVFGKCRACHKLEDGANATGPSLYGVVDRAIAEEPGFSYSDALLGLQGGTWTPEEIDAYVTNPKEYAPGNKMTFAGLKKIEDRANLIAYLATIGG
ncbi:c-type cytochrome [Sinisalibacter aestuarii]|uniref:Cytochrome c n=1 Tax=Sinisalibacter aestuarii TaxID=2949426 RepID=A0ABQ5LMF7_9RHOB|nr:cytochrome c family protein [Sinisalibacter aestuarii]GKY86195.1 cytochrome c [Sinisalibacter aestuarii]